MKKIQKKYTSKKKIVSTEQVYKDVKESIELFIKNLKKKK